MTYTADINYECWDHKDHIFNFNHGSLSEDLQNQTGAGLQIQRAILHKLSFQIKGKVTDSNIISKTSADSNFMFIMHDYVHWHCSMWCGIDSHFCFGELGMCFSLEMVKFQISIFVNALYMKSRSETALLPLNHIVCTST